MAIAAAPPTARPTAGPRPSRAATVAELAAGVILLGLATLGGLVLLHHPWPNRFDLAGFRLLPHSWSAWWAVDTVRVATLPFIVFAVVALVVVVVWRDWARAAACVLGPLAAAFIANDVAKPLVGRHFIGTTALTYPSGTVAVVTALAAAAVLVTPRAARPITLVAALGATVLIGAAVVVLRWHYPTDAVGGAFIGAGSVLAVDAALHLLFPGAAAMPARRPAGARDGRTAGAPVGHPLDPRRPANGGPFATPTGRPSGAWSGYPPPTWPGG